MLILSCRKSHYSRCNRQSMYKSGNTSNHWPQCDVTNCIDSKTYNRTDFLGDALIGWETQVSMTNKSFWSEDLGKLYFGKCHTFQYSGLISNDYRKHLMGFYLKKDMNYWPATGVSTDHSG